MSVIVVEDDEIQLELETLALEAAGFKNVSGFVSPGQALEMIQTAEPDVEAFLLDIMMPEIDGIEMCRRIRTIPKYKHTAVVMMTAKSDRVHIDNAFGAGADDYIIKPFDEIDISQRLKTTLHKKRSPVVTTDQDAEFFFGNDIGYADAAGLTHHETLEAYLSTLDRGRASISMITLFRVKDWAVELEDQSDDEKLEVICTVSSKLKSALSVTSHVLTYCGGGLFVVVTKLGDPAISSTVAAQVSRELERSGAPQLQMLRGKACPHDSDSPALDMLRTSLKQHWLADGPAEVKKSSSRKSLSRIPNLFAF